MRDAHSNLPRPTDVITPEELTIIRRAVNTFVEAARVSGDMHKRFFALEHGHPERREYACLAADAGLLVSRAGAALETLAEHVMSRAAAAGLVDVSMACEWYQEYSRLFLSFEPTECTYFNLAVAAKGVLCSVEPIWFRSFRTTLAEGQSKKEFLERHGIRDA